MKYRSLEEYISTLSESEKIQYGRLIEDHRDREVKIRNNCDESRKRLERLTRNLEECAKAMIALKRSLNALDTNVRDIHWKIFLYARAFSEAAEYGGRFFHIYPTSLN